MECSIIIPVFNQLFYTKLCLEALKRSTSDVACEIIIVDNGSTDGSKEHIEETWPDVKYIRNPENLGFAKGCNIGAACASGEYLVFLNNDTIAAQGWLSALMTAAKNAGGNAAVGSKLLFPNGRIQHAGMAIGEDLWPRALYYTYPADIPGACRQRELQAVTAACMLVGRKIFSDLGGFDERFVNSFEDIDFCIRLKEAGGKVIYCPQSVLYHFESATEGRLKNDEENRRKLIEKWGEKLVPDEARLYMEDGYEVPPKPDYLFLTGQKLTWLLANKENELQRLTEQLMRTYSERDERTAQVTELLKKQKELYERIEELATELHRASKEKIDLAARLEESYGQRDEYARQINRLVEQLQESYRQIDYYSKETNKQSGEYNKQIASLSDQLNLMADRLKEAYAEAEKYAYQARQYADYISANEKEIAALLSRLSGLEESLKSTEATLNRYRSSLPLKIYFKLLRRDR